MGQLKALHLYSPAEKRDQQEYKSENPKDIFEFRFAISLLNSLATTLIINSAIPGKMIGIAVLPRISPKLNVPVRFE